MAQPRGGRTVKTLGAALAKTSRPVGDVAQRTADGLSNVVAGLGTSRDKRYFTSYDRPLPSNRYELDAAYGSSWLADKIVNIFPEDMVREWFDMSWDGLDKAPGDKKTVVDACDALELRDKVTEALTWGRLYGGCVILIGIKGENPALPLNLATVRKGSLQYLHVLDRFRLTPYGPPDKTLGNNLGRPAAYVIAESSEVFHHTRVVRFNGRRLPYFKRIENSGWDGSVLQPLIDNIRDYDTTRAGIASMVFEANVDVIGIEGLYDLVGTAGGEATLTQRFMTAGTMKSFNKMLLIDKDKESHTQKTSTFSGVNEVLEKFMTDVSGGAEIPVTRLFGRSPGGLNATGESDAENWNKTVAAKQTANMRPQLKQLLDVIVPSTLGYTPKNFGFTFNPLSVMSKKDKALIEKSNADRDVAYINAAVLNEGAVARQLKNDNVYTTLEEDDVKMAEELALEPPDAEPAPPPPAIAIAE